MSTLAVSTIQTLVPGLDVLDIQAAGVTFNGGPLPGGGSGYAEIVVNSSTGSIDSIPCGTQGQVLIAFVGGAVTLNGIASAADGKRVILKKFTPGDLTIKYANSGVPADSLIPNTAPSDLIIKPGEAAEFMYTSAGPAWMHISSALVSAGGSGNVAVYDPAIGATTGNRYKTWAEVMTQVTAWGGVGGEIRIRKAGIFQTVTIPEVGTGTYDLSNVKIAPTADTILPILSFTDGCTLTGFPRLLEAVVVENNNTLGPLCTVSTFLISVLSDGSIRNSASATQPALSIPTGANVTLVFDTGLSPLYKMFGGVEPVFLEGTLTLDVWRVPAGSFMSESNLFTNTLSGNGNLNITTRVLVPGGYTRTDANYNGNSNIQHHAEQRVSEIAGEPLWMKRHVGFEMNLHADTSAPMFVKDSGNIMGYFTGGPQIKVSVDGGTTWVSGANVSDTGHASLNVIAGTPYIVRANQSSNTSSYTTNYGASWTAGGTLPSSGSWLYSAATTVGGTPYIVVTKGSSTESAYTTDGGVTWTAGGALPSSGTWTLISTTVGGIPRIVATKLSSTESAYTTDGGVTWTAGGALPSSGVWIGVPVTIGVTPRVVAVKQGAAESAYTTDGGVTWTAGGSYGSHVFNGNSPFCSVADGEILYTILGSNPHSFAYTPDGGVTWLSWAKIISNQHTNLFVFDNSLGKFLYAGGNAIGGTAAYLVGQ